MSDRAVMPLEDYVAACNKVREKTGTTDLIKSGELADKIEAVYENGKIDKDREMWDYITNYNARTDYEKGFLSWGSEYIRPPYKISPTARNSANQTFVNCPTLKKIEAQYFDFSQKLKGNANNSSQHYTFYNCQLLEEIEDIKLQADFGLYATYANCIKLKKIAVVRTDENTVIEEAFNFCRELEEVRFEGVIGRNGLDMHWSPLSHDSLMSVINCLMAFIIADNMTLPYTQTVTLMTNAKLVEGKNYTITYYDEFSFGYLLREGVSATCGKITVNGKETLGVRYDSLHPAGEEYEWYVIVYQDGDDIKLWVNDEIGFAESRIVSLKVEGSTTHTITLGTANLNKLSNEEKQIVTKKGWSVL